MPKPPLQMLLPQRTPPPMKITHVAATDPASAVTAPSESFAAPRIILNTIDTSPEPPIAVGNLPGSMASGPGFLSSLAEVPHPAVRVAEAPASHAPVHISSGISTGLLLTPIRPVYPAMAKVTHTEGTVVVEAIISKSGGIESLRVVSGPALLQSAAIDAIRVARYRPFLLNGEPVEVQTTITVNFRMSN